LPNAPRDRCDACVMRAMIDDFVGFIVQSRHIFGAIRNPLLSIEVHNFQPLLLQHGHTHRAKLRARRFEFSQRSNMSLSSPTSIRATETTFVG
jgi:hypothetical protein